MSNTSRQTISTSDIVLAATLKVKGFVLNRIEKNGNKGIFIFDDVEVGVIEDYDLGKCLVEPIAFNNAIKALTTATRRIV
jgi:hypothetical protein